MKNRHLPFLLPFRCIIFFLIFIISSAVLNKSLDEISNIWSVVATVVNIITIFILIAIII